MNTKMNSKALSILSTLTASFALALGATGCVFSASVEPDPIIVVDDPAPAPGVAMVDIDPGVAMSASPGEGVGVFVTYDRGGFWNVFTTCDTAITGASCNFDVLVYADPRVILEDVQGADLSYSDSLTLGSDGSINLVTDTSFGMNGMSFFADPGAVVTVDVLLDGNPAPEYVYVSSNGRLLSGVPTNPVDFAPVAP